MCKTLKNPCEFHLYCWDHVYKVNEWCLVDFFHREPSFSTQIMVRDYCIAKCIFFTIQNIYVKVNSELRATLVRRKKSGYITDLLLPNEQFYEICSQLNEDQQHLFKFIMQYTLHCKLAEKNNELPHKPFHIFLSRGAGKSFLIKPITDYLKRVLRYLNQNLDNHLFL